VDILAVIVAAAALVIAVVALALAWRVTAEGRSDHVIRARRDARERQVDQLTRRLEAVEAGGTMASGAVAAPGASAEAGPPTPGAAISHIGLVRFDAFEDAGGAQSFAVALLDDAGDGLVLTSLHSRPTTRLYVKAIRAGTADAPLSEEEERAMLEAGLRTVAR